MYNIISHFYSSNKKSAKCFIKKIPEWIRSVLTPYTRPSEVQTLILSQCWCEERACVRACVRSERVQCFLPCVRFDVCDSGVDEWCVCELDHTLSPGAGTRLQLQHCDVIGRRGAEERRRNEQSDLRTTRRPITTHVHAVNPHLTLY